MESVLLVVEESTVIQDNGSRIGIKDPEAEIKNENALRE